MTDKTPQKKIAWITGASSGIGRATALELAREGWIVAVTARSEDKLAELVKEAASMAGHVIAVPGDVTKAEKMNEIVKTIENTAGPLDLAILNAGTYYPDTVEDFSAETTRQQFEINVNGTMNALEPALNVFKARNKGHVAIVSSIAGYRGLPYSLSYGATKAALINFTEALAAECRDTGIKIQLICPGFIKTPLTDKNDFPMPMLMPVDDAAKALVKGLKSNKFEITFPWLFCFITAVFGWILPNRAYIWAISKIKEGQRGNVDDNSDSDKGDDNGQPNPSKAA